MFEQIAYYLYISKTNWSYKMADKKAKTKKEIKFTADELQSLQELKVGFETIQNTLGAMEISRIQFTERLENLEDEKLRIEAEYSTLRERETKLVQELNEKYGAGNLDPATGVFTPQK